LFNRLLGHRVAVVHDRPGVTRDRHFREWDFEGRRCDLVDTGGFIDETMDPLAHQVRQQINLALDAADVVLFMIDARTGLTYDDLQLARQVQRGGKPVLLLANKAEKPADRESLTECLKLGLGLPNPVSATTGYGMDGLIERLRLLVPVGGVRPKDDNKTRVAILGRPNAGKSTLVNRLLGEERMIVSAVPGTTRDSVDAQFVWEGHHFQVTDTAGLRKKARVKDDVEYYSNMRSLESIRRSHVVVLLVDCTASSMDDGLPEQDLRILRQVEEAGKGLVIGLAKWDALTKDSKTYDAVVKDMRLRIPAIAETPIIAFSGLDGQRVPRLLAEVIRVREGLVKVLGREKVIEYFDEALRIQKPPYAHGHPITLTRCCQVHVDPPMLAFETENPDLVSEAYRRFLRARAIEFFDIGGVPLRIAFRDKLELRTDEDLARFGGDHPLPRTLGQKSEARRSRKPKAEKPKPDAGPVTPAEVWVPRVVRKAKSLHEAKPTERPARKAREPKPLSAAKLSKVGNPTKQPRAKTGPAPKSGPKAKGAPKAGPKSAMKPGAAKKAPNRGARKPR
jgi:GTP-binding protein